MNEYFVVKIEYPKVTFVKLLPAAAPLHEAIKFRKFIEESYGIVSTRVVVCKLSEHGRKR